MYALNADRRAEVEDIVDIAAHRNRELVDRTRIHHIHRMQHRGVAADTLHRPDRVLHRSVVPQHIGVVGQYGRPDIGIPRIDGNRSVRASALGLAVGPYTEIIHLLRKDIGDRRHQPVGPVGIVARFRRKRVAAVEIRDAVHADTERQAGQGASRTLEDVQGDAHVSECELRFAVPLPRGRSRGRCLRHGHERRERNLVAAVHAQSRRVERHRRQVGAQRGESPAHTHHAGRAENVRLRKLRQIGSPQHVVVQHRTAEFETRILRLQRRRSNEGRAQCHYFHAFHNSLRFSCYRLP